MDLDAIRRYRAAVFSRRLTSQLSEARSQGSTDDWPVAIDRVRAALGIDDAPSSSLMDFHEWSSSDFADDKGIADIAARVTLMVSEVQLMQFGANEGYYPAELRQQTLASLQQDAGPTLAPLLTAVDDSDSHRSGHDSFTTLQVFWSEAATPEMRQCVQLVAFSNYGAWHHAIGRVDRLATRLRQNPFLHLAPGEADDLSWALTGAENLFLGGVYLPDPEGRANMLDARYRGVNVDLSWSAAFRAFSSEAAQLRVEELRAAQDSILAIQDFMFDDPSVASARWLLASGRDVAAPGEATAPQDPGSGFEFGGGYYPSAGVDPS
jgi:hypothetical protein